jgi:hypothetical protein
VTLTAEQVRQGLSTVELDIERWPRRGAGVSARPDIGFTPRRWPLRAQLTLAATAHSTQPQVLMDDNCDEISWNPKKPGVVT